MQAPITLPIPMLGTIGPSGRIAAGEIDDIGLSNICTQLAGSDFFVPTSVPIPTQCVDGRPRADGTCVPQPNAAAGTFTIVIADALTTGQYRTAHENAALHAKAVYTYLIQHGLPVGGHDADHVVAPGCGCGAEDKLADMLAYIRDHGEEVQGLLAAVNVAVDDDTHRMIVAQAAQLLDGSYVVPGEDLRQAYIDTAGEKSVETLAGAHNEVVLVINTQAGTTLDRAKLAGEFHNIYQAFNVDVPAIETAVKTIATTEVETAQKLAAALYYNVATAAVLADKSLCLVVR